MCNPTAQAYHGIERTDDADIADGDRVLRHIRTVVQLSSVRRDGIVIGRTVSDQAFKPRRDEPGVSVDLECLLNKENLTWEARYGVMPDTVAMIAVSAADARLHGRGVAWTPKPEEPNLAGFQAEANPYHGEILTPLAPADFRALRAKAQILRSDLG